MADNSEKEGNIDNLQENDDNDDIGIRMREEVIDMSEENSKEDIVEKNDTSATDDSDNDDDGELKRAKQTPGDGEADAEKDLTVDSTNDDGIDNDDECKDDGKYKVHDGSGENDEIINMGTSPDDNLEDGDNDTRLIGEVASVNDKTDETEHDVDLDKTGEEKGDVDTDDKKGNDGEEKNDREKDNTGELEDDKGGGGGGDGGKSGDLTEVDVGDTESNRTSQIKFALQTDNDSMTNKSGTHENIGADNENIDGQGVESSSLKLESVAKSDTDKKSSKSKKGKTTKTVRVRSSKTVSSIEVDMSRIMRSPTRGGEGDSDDDDAVTRVTFTKSVDFSLPVDDEVEEELQRVIERPGSGRLSMMDEDFLYVGRAATMNTPVTNDDRESFLYQRSIRTPSREGIYEHALNLIHNRCRIGSVYSSRSQPHSRRGKSDPPPRSAASLPATLVGGVPMFDLPNVVEHINQDPFAAQPNSYFYISQSRPLPMKPLKVWKGYRGNVYFEPMVCRKAKMASHSPKDPSKGTSRFPSILKSNGAGNTSEGSKIAPKSATTIRTNSQQEKNMRGTKSALSRRSTNVRQLAILDKSSVLERMDYNTAEDIQWISGIESTGTLQIGESNAGLTGRSYRIYRNGPKHPKLRIRRGLVSHDLATGSTHTPKLGVRGGHINGDGAVVAPQRHSQQLNRHPRDTDQDTKTVSQSYPSDKYSCVDPISALKEIMNRNDGHGRSKLVHILPSATYTYTSPMERHKGK